MKSILILTLLALSGTTTATVRVSKTKDNLVRLLQSEMDTMSLVEKRDTIVGVLASFVPSVIDLLTQAITVTIESFVPEAGQNAIVKTILNQVNLALKNVTTEALAPVLAAQIAAA